MSTTWTCRICRGPAAYPHRYCTGCDAMFPPLPSTLAQRFWAKVSVAAPDECWLWTAYRMPNGYGQIGRDGRAALAHRVSYELATGVDPGPLEVCHRCDNPPCVNPSHLFLGDHATNMRDSVAKGRAKGGRSGMTHCTRGHEYTEANTWVSSEGRRKCRECHRKYEANRRRIRQEMQANG